MKSLVMSIIGLRECCGGGSWADQCLMCSILFTLTESFVSLSPVDFFDLSVITSSSDDLVRMFFCLSEKNASQ